MGDFVSITVNINIYLIQCFKIRLLGGRLMTGKERIIAKFRKDVKGKKPDTSGANAKHDGKEGHWLEKQFGIVHNANNSADLYGYELKNETSSKITFGDWSANLYIFDDPRISHIFEGKTSLEKRDSFIRMFGKPNEKKGGRHSWSGEPCPKIAGFNRFGQKLMITAKKDIVAVYDYREDKRDNKNDIIPDEIRDGLIVLARWYGEKSPNPKAKCLKARVEDKFNDKGWFTCKKDSSGAYKEVCFGEPMNFDSWLKLVQQGIVFLDSGMYIGNNRKYSQWRSNNSYWDSLIVERYE